MRPQQIADALKFGACRQRVECETRELYELRGTFHQVSQQRWNIGPAVRAHAGKSSTRHFALGGIDDDAQRGEGQSMGFGQPRDDVGFHIACRRTGGSA